jgi:hypothetical protein
VWSWLSWPEVVSAGVGVIALVAALLMWTLAGRFCPPLVLFLTVTGFAGIYSTVVGTWIRTGISWVTDRTAAWGHATGITLIGLAALLLAGFVIIRTVQWFTNRAKEIAGVEERPEPEQQDRFGRVIIAGSVLPAVVTSIPGTVGAFITLLLGGPVTGLAWLINAGFGWH